MHYVALHRRTRSTWAYNLILPWVTLAFLYAALYARLTRAGMLETMNEDYIRTARAKGLPERTVVVKHGLRAALTPILTIFGLDLGLLLGGAVLTETTFSLPGPRAAASSTPSSRNDLPMVMGVTLVAAFFIVVANLVVDVLYAVVDPRVRLVMATRSRRRDAGPPTRPSQSFLEVRDLRIHFPTDDGLVKAVDGALASRWSAAAPSASSASPARASP